MDGLLYHQGAVTVRLDSDDFRISQPFDMDKATLLPLRGSLGRKPGRATQAKVRAREKYKKMQKKKTKKMKKIKRKDEKEKRRKEMKRIEKKRRTKLARMKTQKGRPWQKLERIRRG